MSNGGRQSTTRNPTARPATRAEHPIRNAAGTAVGSSRTVVDVGRQARRALAVRLGAVVVKGLQWTGGCAGRHALVGRGRRSMQAGRCTLVRQEGVQGGMR